MGTFGDGHFGTGYLGSPVAGPGTFGWGNFGSDTFGGGRSRPEEIKLAVLAGKSFLFKLNAVTPILQPAAREIKLATASISVATVRTDTVEGI